MISLSIIIPVFNEDGRLMKTFAALSVFFAKKKFSDAEVVFVDDGSKDRTAELIKNFRPDVSVRLVSYSSNKGKGCAVRTGMLEARHEHALMIDADMSTSLDEFLKFAPLVEQGADIIIGTRKAGGARVTKYQPLYRRKMGEAYTMFANLILGVGVSDFTCGFKCFSRTAREKIFRNAFIDRWSYDAEILFLAKKFGFKIWEVPVEWANDEDTKVSLGKDALESFLDLVKIKIHKYSKYDVKKKI